MTRSLRTAVWFGLTFATATLAISASTATAVTMIDDFSEGGVSFTVKTPDSTNGGVQMGLASVLGGRRVTLVGVEQGGLDDLNLDSVTIRVSPAGGVFDYASSAGADGFASLEYSDVGSVIGDLSGNSFIQIDFTHFDLANGQPMTVAVGLGQGPNFAFLEKSLGVAGASSMIFDFASFVDIDTIDLSTLTEVFVLFDPVKGADFRVSGIRADVPEAASLTLLAIGSIALLNRTAASGFGRRSR